MHIRVHDDLENAGEVLVHALTWCLRFELEVLLHVYVHGDLEFGSEALVHAAGRPALYHCTTGKDRTGGPPPPSSCCSASAVTT